MRLIALILPVTYSCRRNETSSNQQLPMFQRGNQSTHLSHESDSTGLTLGADASRPWRMVCTPGLDLATEVLQIDKLTSGERERKNRSIPLALVPSLPTHLSTPLVSFLT